MERGDTIDSGMAEVTVEDLAVVHVPSIGDVLRDITKEVHEMITTLKRMRLMNILLGRIIEVRQVRRTRLLELQNLLALLLSLLQSDSHIPWSDEIEKQLVLEDKISQLAYLRSEIRRDFVIEWRIQQRVHHLLLSEDSVPQFVTRTWG